MKKMDEFLRDLAATLIGVVAAKGLDLAVEALKKKASSKHRKH